MYVTTKMGQTKTQLKLISDQQLKKLATDTRERGFVDHEGYSEE